MKKQNIKKAATISDIAKAAHTSTATVSRVLSGADYPVSDSMRKLVHQIAGELNYSPNLLGRMLKKNETNDIGVIVPTIQNPFYTQVLIGIEAEAKKNGYDILLYNSFSNVNAERRQIKKLCQKQTKGIIISSIDHCSTALTEFIQTGGKVVLFDQDADVPGSIKVRFDFIKASRMAVDYLISMGHRSIAFLSPPLVIKSRIDNLEGYKQSLSANGIAIDPENIIIAESEPDQEINGMHEFENGRKLAKLFYSLEKHPTAIFTVNDITAFGIIQQLAADGISVPNDVSVMGFDNIEISKMVNPPLTTVNQPSFETGRIAGKLLIDSFKEGSMGSNFTVLLDSSIVIRNSVKQIG